MNTYQCMTAVTSTTHGISNSQVISEVPSQVPRICWKGAKQGLQGWKLAGWQGPSQRDANIYTHRASLKVPFTTSQGSSGGEGQAVGTRDGFREPVSTCGPIAPSQPQAHWSASSTTQPHLQIFPG